MTFPFCDSNPSSREGSEAQRRCLRGTRGWTAFKGVGEISAAWNVNPDIPPGCHCIHTCSERAPFGNTQNLVAVAHGPIHQNVVLAQLTAVASQRHPPTGTRNNGNRVKPGKCCHHPSCLLPSHTKIHVRTGPSDLVHARVPFPKRAERARSITCVLELATWIRCVCTRGNLFPSPVLQPMRVCARVSVLYKDCTQLFSLSTLPTQKRE